MVETTGYSRNFSNGSGRYSLWWSCDSCDPSTSGHTGGTAGKEQVGLWGIKTHGHRGGGRRRAGPDSQASGISWLELPPVVVLARSPLTPVEGGLHSDKDPSSTEDLEKGYNPLRPKVIACTSVLWGLKELSCLWLSVPKESKLTRVETWPNRLNEHLVGILSHRACNAPVISFPYCINKDCCKWIYVITGLHEVFQENPTVTASCTPWEMVTSWAESQITLGLIMPKSTHVPERYLRSRLLPLVKTLGS